MNKGDKVEFWLTIKGKPTHFIGVVRGFTYTGLVEVTTGYHSNDYRHKLNKAKLKVLEPIQLPLIWDEVSEFTDEQYNYLLNKIK